MTFSGLEAPTYAGCSKISQAIAWRFKFAGFFRAAELHLVAKAKVESEGKATLCCDLVPNGGANLKVATGSKVLTFNRRTEVVVGQTAAHKPTAVKMLKVIVKRSISSETSDAVVKIKCRRKHTQ